MSTQATYCDLFMITVHFDGSFEPNNQGGLATFGFILKQDDEVLYLKHGLAGLGHNMSNNVAEYCAVIEAMQYLIKNDLINKDIEVLGDSMMVVKQLSGTWKAKKGLYFPYYLQAKELVKNFHNIDFTWVPRAKNQDADTLSKPSYLDYASQPKGAI